MADPAEGTSQSIARPNSGASMREVRKFANHRVLALIDQTFDLMDEEKAKGKRDPVAALADAYHRDPLAFLERVRVLSADNGNAPGRPGAKSLGLQALFVSAAREMAASGNGVQVGLVEAQVIDNTEIDW